MKIKETEAQFQKRLTIRLTLAGWLVLRNNAGAIRFNRSNGSEGFAKLGESGRPDLEAIKNGKTIYIEVKTDSGKLSPSQDETITKMQRHGAVVFVVKPTKFSEIYHNEEGFFKMIET